MRKLNSIYLIVVDFLNKFSGRALRGVLTTYTLPGNVLTVVVAVGLVTYSFSDGFEVSLEWSVRAAVASTLLFLFASVMTLAQDNQNKHAESAKQGLRDRYQALLGEMVKCQYLPQKIDEIEREMVDLEAKIKLVETNKRAKAIETTFIIFISMIGSMFAIISSTSLIK